MKFILVILFAALAFCPSNAVKSTTIRRVHIVNRKNWEAEYLKAAVVLPEISEQRLQRRATTIIARPGNAVEEHACGTITAVPGDLRTPENMYPKGLDDFYQKYTHAYGIPVVASNKVSDTALKRACYLLRFMLADRPDVRESFYKMFGRLALMAPDEVTTDIPEHSDLESRYWDERARGLGASRTSPVSTGGEENVVCLKKDRYPHQDIVLHELAHSIHHIGAQYAIPGFDARLKSLYNSAKAKGLWDNTYAMTNHREYWAEVVQSYFNDNAIARPANGNNNDIHNKKKLKTYDPDMYAFIDEIWPCQNTYLPRCLTSRELEQAQVLKMNCNGTTNNYFSYDASCTDSNFNCPGWASNGECTRNSAYMLRNCKKSCRRCTTTSCTDSNFQCPDWALNGCSKTSAYMLSNCKRSCRQCTTTYRGQANKGFRSAVAPLASCTDTTSGCNALSCTTNIDYNIKQCRQTCTGCQYYVDLLSNDCSDQNDSCANWASVGECERNPNYMLSRCKKSCKVLVC